MRYGSVQNAEIHLFCSENRNFLKKNTGIVPMKDKLFLQSSSTYFAKSVVLTLESQLCSMDKLVYCLS